MNFDFDIRQQFEKLITLQFIIEQGCFYLKNRSLYWDGSTGHSLST